jgi:hypothetical protein
MALVREMGPIIVGLEDTVFVTCSNPLSTAGSTSPALNKINSTADAIAQGNTETTAFGVLIDRLSPLLGARFNVAMVGSHYHASAGSTEADRKITLGVRLQHGDSSGGGDQAEYSTQNAKAARQYFSTARTSDMLNWDGSLSTGPIFAVSNATYYDLRAAKRYIRLAVPVFKNRVTTESSGDEPARVGGSIAFLSGDRLPEVLGGAYGSATST